MAVIKFGTSGWRDIIADKFTYDNVALAAFGISTHLIEQKEAKKGLFIGYDTRFMSREFAMHCASTAAGCGIKVLFSEREVPTPVISFEVIDRKLGGAINITASHNPPEYNGIKFSPFTGAPARKEDTKRIEEIALDAIGRKLPFMPFGDGVKKGVIKIVTPGINYRKKIERMLDKNLFAKNRKFSFAVDMLYGAGRGFLDSFLSGMGQEPVVLHNTRDALFGGHPPEPAGEYLGDLLSVIKKGKNVIGLALDGDADRFGIIDTDGRFYLPNEILAILLDYLVRVKGYSGAAVRTVATSHFIDAVAAKYNIKMHEVPVGFKYIGDKMLSEDIIIGGEESGGLSVKGHVPEKDGILACLLVAEMVLYYKKPLKEIMGSLFSEVGSFYTERVNIRFKSSDRESIIKKMENYSPMKICGRKVLEKKKLDGYKFILEDGSWLMIRFSGTEPVVRCYLEASSPEKLSRLKKESLKLVEL